MGKKQIRAAAKVDERPKRDEATAVSAGRPSALLDTRVVYCGDNLEELAKLPDGCVDRIYIDPPLNPDWRRRSVLGRTLREASGLPSPIVQLGPER